jgi:hypothetical protein
MADIRIRRTGTDNRRKTVPIECPFILQVMCGFDYTELLLVSNTGIGFEILHSEEEDLKRFLRKHGITESFVASFHWVGFECLRDCWKNLDVQLHVDFDNQCYAQARLRTRSRTVGTPATESTQ